MVDSQALLGSVLYKFANADFVQSLQKDYVKFFKKGPPGKVLDLGCGRGLFLKLLRDAGLEAAGVDGHAESVELCRKEGFGDVEVGDVLEYIEKHVKAGTKYRGIFCSHLIEHLDGDTALRLVAGCANLLAPGGRLVIVTPNVANLLVWTHVFWLDPTHVRPYPRALLEALMRAADLRVVKSFDDWRTRRKYGLATLVRLPLSLLRNGTSIFSGMDSLVVAER
ncbi:MAG: class I SAM-dependent methyltransferase [Sandaracinaceae bacterium]|nr:class I SAM-dependent methyltransferase [Sandaracinaceae bacterium]